MGTKNNLDEHYGESTLTTRTVHYQFQHYRDGHVNINDTESIKRIDEATILNINNQIHQVATSVRRLKEFGIGEDIVISNKRVHDILTNIRKKMSGQ